MASTELATKQNTFRDLMKKHAAAFDEVLPKQVGIERFVRVALGEVLRTPNLLKCDMPTVMSSLLEAAKVGLEPGVAGLAYLVPYGRKCQLIIGYKGLLQLARRSGEIHHVDVREVYEGDKFDWQFGLHPDLVHFPSDCVDPKKITHVYAIVHLKDGGFQMEVMARAQIEIIRNRAPAGQSGAWVTDWMMMARKTVLIRVLKLCPMAVETLAALERDENRERGIDSGAPEPVFVEQPAPASKMETFVESLPAPEAEPEPEAEKPTPEPPPPADNKHLALVSLKGKLKQWKLKLKGVVIESALRQHEFVSWTEVMDSGDVVALTALVDTCKKAAIGTTTGKDE